MKYLKCISLTLLMFGCFLCFANTVYAHDNILPADRGIVLHKLIIEEDDYPSTSINNNGQALDPNKLPSQIGLNNVEFTLYSLTEQLNALLDSGKSPSEAQEILAAQSYDYNTLTVIQTARTASVNGRDGIARFNLNNEPVTAAYLILETGTPANVSVIADPIVIVFPAYDEQGKVLSMVYVYPKNVLKDTPSSSSVISSSIPNSKSNSYKSAVNSSINGAKTGVNQKIIIVLIAIMLLTFLFMVALIVYKSKK